MKTKIIILISLVAILTGTPSCDDFLSRYPEGELLKDDALKTGEDVRMLQNSTYTVLFSGNFLGGRSQIISELLTDNILGTALDGDWAVIYNRTSSIFEGIIGGLWAEPFIAIYRANNVLENLSLIDNPTIRQTVEGEARFVRALAHFEILRLFSQPYGYSANNTHLGIPIKTSSTPQAALRAPVQDVYNFLIAELEECEDILPTENDLEYDPFKAYPTKWSAKALLARIYFQMNNFDKAYAYANEVITLGPAQFNSSDTEFMQRYSLNGSAEALFKSVSASKNQVGETVYVNRGGEFTGLMRSVSSIPYIKLTQSAYNFGTSDATDKRAALWYESVDGFNYIKKFNSSLTLSVPIITITELKLIRAESAAERGTNLSIAQADLQDIYNRAYGIGIRVAPFDPTALILEVRIQRRLEFVCEGHLGHDLKRIGALGRETVTVRGAPWNCPGAVLQFPQSEIVNNPGFVKNPEGGC
jgi:starch-binding outer membrane protein, SusD/RagB family